MDFCGLHNALACSGSLGVLIGCAGETSLRCWTTGHIGALKLSFYRSNILLCHELKLWTSVSWNIGLPFLVGCKFLLVHVQLCTYVQALLYPVEWAVVVCAEFRHLLLLTWSHFIMCLFQSVDAWRKVIFGKNSSHAIAWLNPKSLIFLVNW